MNFNDLREYMRISVEGTANSFSNDVESFIGLMSASGVSQSEIKNILRNDLTERGRIFGSLKNNSASTIRNGMENASNVSTRQAYEKAGIKRFRWVSAGGKVCPDCENRAGVVGEMGYFDSIGLPKSGFSVCGRNCQCQLVPIGYEAEGTIIRKVPAIKSTKPLSTFAKSVSLKGLKKEYSEVIENTLNRLNRKKYFTQKLESIGFSEKTGKELGRLTHSADPTIGDKLWIRKSLFTKHLGDKDHNLFLKENAKKLKEKENIKQTISKRNIIGKKKLLEDIDYRIEKLTNTFRHATYEDVGSLKKIDSVVTHELGHHIDFTYGITDGWSTTKGSKFGRYLKKNKVTEIDTMRVSRYARRNELELFAETFTLYETGRKSQIPSRLLKALEEILEDSIVL